MSVAAVAHHPVLLPDTPYALWVDGSLPEHLRIPADGFRVEIVNGQIVVSPAQAVDHNGIVADIQGCMTTAAISGPSFPWRCIHSTDLNLVQIQDGYVPDLIVLAADVLEQARRERRPFLLPEQIELAVEVTSPSNANYDRAPALRRPDTKWTGYARVRIPYYLLVDRAPKAAHAVLYSDPDHGSGTYLNSVTWEFGETIKLPEPFGFEIDTAGWLPWE